MFLLVSMMPQKAKTNKIDKRKKKTDDTDTNNVDGKTGASDVEAADLKTGASRATNNEQPPKFKFDCQLCGLCCETETVYVTINDLDHWIKDNTIYLVMHLLDIEESEGKIKIYIRKDDDGKCNLYHRDKKQCTFYESRPIACRSYPLGYNGEKYYLKSKKS